MVIFSIFHIAVPYDITVSSVQLLLVLSAKEVCTTTVYQPHLQSILMFFKMVHTYPHLGREHYLQTAITTDELLRFILWNFCDIIALILENSCTMIWHQTLSRLYNVQDENN